MTVTELKDIIKNWPETDKNGDPCQVWIGNEKCTSDEARSAWPLNVKTTKSGSSTYDMLISKEL